MKAPALDPRIEEILRDIAKDPRARLLRPDPARLAAAAAAQLEPPSPAQARLRSAERELLAAHRAETAEALRLRAELLLSNPLAAGSTNPAVRFTPGPGRWASNAADVERWRTRTLDPCVSAVTAGVADSRSAEALGQLEGIREESRGLDPAVRLAAAAVRLHPQDRTRATLARVLAADGQYLAARRLALGVLADASGPRASLAWDIVGTCAYHIEGAPAALEAYERDLEHGPLRVLPLLIAAVMSLEGRRTDARERCESRLIQDVEPDDSIVGRYAEWLQGLRRSGRWSPGVTVDSLRAWMESPHENLRKIARVLA